MDVSKTMDLRALSERMGDASSGTVVELAAARHMCAALAGLDAWQHTEDVPTEEWKRLLEAAVAQTKHNPMAAALQAHWLANGYDNAALAEGWVLVPSGCSQ